MAKRKKRLTERFVKALPPAPPGRSLYYSDSGQRGLTLVVTGTGLKTWYWRRGSRKVRLGPWPEMGVIEARSVAQQLSVREERFLTPAPRLGEFFQEWLTVHAQGHRKSWPEDARAWRLYLRPLEAQRMDKITTRDLQHIHAQIGAKSGQRTANKAIFMLRAAYNKAIEWKLVVDNPCQNVRIYRAAEQPRERYLKPDEMPRFLNALKSESNTTMRDFFLMCLWTGARKSNVLAMRWNQLSLDAGIWYIPRVKTGKPQAIPLTLPAMTILEQRDKSAPWVFPGVGRTGHLVSPTKAWQRVCQRAEICGLRIHDLRRTMGSWQAATVAQTPT